MTILLPILDFYARCVVKQQKISAKVKDKIRNLVQETRLIEHMPHGAIKEITEKLNKERGTVRGALQGKWVNIEVLEVSIELIENEIDRLSCFVEDFKERLEPLKK